MFVFNANRLNSGFKLTPVSAYNEKDAEVRECKESKKSHTFPDVLLVLEA
jgi:hypothetical protein